MGGASMVISIPPSNPLCTPEQSHLILPTAPPSDRVESNSTDFQGPEGSINSPESSHQSAHFILTANSDKNNVDGFKTTLAASIAKIIEYDDTLREFNELRSVRQRSPNNLKDKVVRYNMLTAKLSLQILGQRTERDTIIKAFEHATQ